MRNLLAGLTTGLDVVSATPVAGGDISAAFRLETPRGLLFAKAHHNPRPGMFAREATGLLALSAAADELIGVPDVVRVVDDGIVLSWIEEGRRGAASEASFGRGLATIHRTTAPAFGGLVGAEDGYIGSMRVDLTPTTSWSEFYVTRRLQPMAGEAIARGRLDPRARALIDQLASRADELCGPPEPPALVHGDLWAGNRLVDRTAKNWLIDPAVHFAHREVDLAMMALFGGFGPTCFAAYDEAFPLASGWRDRVTWYQLTPLLVHAYLFGGSYGESVMTALRRYA